MRSSRSSGRTWSARSPERAAPARAAGPRSAPLSVLVAEPGRLPFDPIAEAMRHWREHGWEQAVHGMGVVTSVIRVEQILAGRAEDEVRPFGLTFARYEVLMLLLFSKRGELPLGKIGERLQVAPGSVTNAVSRLERDRLVRRRVNPDDGRGVLAAITPRSGPGTGRHVQAQRLALQRGGPVPVGGRHPVSPTRQAAAADRRLRLSGAGRAGLLDRLPPEDLFSAEKNVVLIAGIPLIAGMEEGVSAGVRRHRFLPRRRTDR